MASMGPDRARTFVGGILERLKESGALNTYHVQVYEDGLILLKWSGHNPLAQWQISRPLSEFNPGEAAVESVMGS